jgi:predicted phosphodiesterase
MRFLVVSDIHGNRFGLEAVLADAAGAYDTLLCLGDVVGYGAHPNECCQILHEHNAVSLSGNHDAAALGLISIEWFNPVAKAAIEWTRAQLSDENRVWLRTLPAQQDWPEHDFQTVHGSLREPWEEYIVGQAIAAATFKLMTRSLCFFGHTHIAACYAEGTPEGEPPEVQGVALTHGGEIGLVDIDDEEPVLEWKYLINPGSCGQPRDTNRQARYAIFDSELRHVEVRPVDYDWDAARRAIIEAGLPHMLGDRLLQGR